MTKPHSTIHQILCKDDGKPYQATGCFNPWIGDAQVFAMPRAGNKVVPFLSGKEYFADLIQSVDAAQEEVLIIGWQVSWDALLAPNLRLYNLVYRNARRGVKFYFMLWDDSDPVQTYDDQTRLVFEDINRRLNLKDDKKVVHVILSPAYAAVNASYFSHHQKCVIVDRKIGYMGGMDVSYGRYDTPAYALKPDTDGRQVLNRYNPCIAWEKDLVWNEEDPDKSEVVDPDFLSGFLDKNLTPNTAKNAKMAAKASAGGSILGKILPPSTTQDNRTEEEKAKDKLTLSEKTSDRIYNGGWQAPYEENFPFVDSNKRNLKTLDERMQPRMPWQDVHCRMEGPIVADLIKNFVARWHIKSEVKLKEPPPHTIFPEPGSVRIQFLRSAPAELRKKEYAAVKKTFPKIYGHLFPVPPTTSDDSIQQAMIRLIDNAAHFIYIENQFFMSGFGEQRREPEGDLLSPVGLYIKNDRENGLSNTKLKALRAYDSESASYMDRLPQNDVCQALVGRIRQAIFDAAKPNFHVYITLPVHPEGKLNSHSIAAQVYWTMQTITNGSHSLLNGIRRALKARELRDKKSPYQAVLDDPANTEYESIPLEACEQYVTLLNLRNWEKIGPNVVTEQIYVHTKLMIVDDRFVLLGSANVNDRSMTGERDSEIAALMIDTSASTCDIGACGKKPVRTFARELRMGIWKKLFGITGKVRPASHLLKAIEQPASPASWQAIQKQAKANAVAYEKAFPFIPKNWSGRKTDDDVPTPIPASVLPTWNGKELTSPVPGQSKFWQKPQFKADGVVGLEQIKGFITALPIHWTGKENLDFGVPTAILVNNDVPIDNELKPDAGIAVGSAEGPEGESHA